MIDPMNSKINFALLEQVGLVRRARPGDPGTVDVPRTGSRAPEPAREPPPSPPDPVRIARPTPRFIVSPAGPAVPSTPLERLTRTYRECLADNICCTCRVAPAHNYGPGLGFARNCLACSEIQRDRSARGTTAKKKLASAGQPSDS